MGKAAKSEAAEVEGDEQPHVSVYDLPHVELEPPGMARLAARMREYEEDYFERSRVASERYPLEHSAATTMQRYWRGFLVRRNIRRHREHAEFCQRIWRGYLGRCRFKERLEHHNRKLRMDYFELMANRIQKWFRGYISRKNVHSFYARKRYLQQIAEKNAETRQMLAQEFQNALQQQQQQEEEKARARFGSTISKMHHLVSTTAQAGIFSSPYNRVTGGPVMVAGRPVEEHLHSSVKGIWSPKASLKRGVDGPLPPITDRPPASNYSKAGRLAALKSLGTPASPNLSLQASTPYSMVHDANQIENFLDRMDVHNKHPQDFVTTVREPLPDRHNHFQLPALKNDTEFLEPISTGRQNPDSVTEKMRTVHPHITKPFKTAIAKQPLFQDSLNIEREYYLSRLSGAQQVE